MRVSKKFLPSISLLVSAASVCTSAYGQVLNLSKVLVSMGIATSHMTPDTCSLDRGSYYFLSLSSSYQHVYWIHGKCGDYKY